MLTYVESSIWQSPAHTLVNAVNTVGVMGKGIALQFKKKYPEMYEKYRALCDSKRFEVGSLWLYKGNERWVLNFPTKKDWRQPSRPEYIEAGLQKFLLAYEVFNITSISFPQLGTGNGGLDWRGIVQPLMEKYLRNIPIPVYVHLMPREAGFLPEYLLPVNQAIPFEALLADIRALVGVRLHTNRAKTEYVFSELNDEELIFRNNKGNVKVTLEDLQFLWSDLNMKKMVNSSNAVGQLQKNYSYLMPLLSRIKYVHTVNASDDLNALKNSPSKSLMLATKENEQVSSRKYELSLL